MILKGTVESYVHILPPPTSLSFSFLSLYLKEIRIGAFCLHVWLCTTCMQYYQRPEEGTGFSGIGVNSCELQCEC